VQQCHQIKENKHDKRKRIPDYKPSFNVIPVADFHIIPNIKVSGSSKFPVNPHKLAKISIAFCTDIPCNFRPHIDTDIVFRNNVPVYVHMFPCDDGIGNKTKAQIGIIPDKDVAVNNY
jgi:hypothetical protein